MSSNQRPCLILPLQYDTLDNFSVTLSIEHYNQSPLYIYGETKKLGNNWPKSYCKINQQETIGFWSNFGYSSGVEVDFEFTQMLSEYIFLGYVAGIQGCIYLLVIGYTKTVYDTIR
uniref:Uncharacterized protein n=1 Tax=Glossina brevipalpis TaxID=37001 RepID=A0A1A9WZ55_9MUSC